ncbi:exopolysaccharide transport family protein, partial [Novosphingobium sp. B1]|uniref:GumC family protein n=1 Tax=Novosphingobium sp. B1 TaxID=1938756 RepID=UPI0015932A5D
MDPYRAPAPVSTMGGGITLGYLFEVVRRHWIAMALVFGAVLGAAIVALLLIQPRYVATTRIKIDPNQAAMIGVAAGNARPDPGSIDTEVAAMQSRDIAVMVINRLRLMYDPEFAPKADTPNSSPNARVDAVAGRLLSELNVKRERDTYVINISYRSVNAIKAAEVANAFAEAYMNSSVGSRTGTAAKQVEFLTGRLNTLGSELAGIESKAAQLRAQAGIIGGGTGGSFSGTVTDQRVSAQSSQLSAAQSAASAAEARYNVARQQLASGGLDNVSAVLESPVITNLRAQRAEVVRNLGSIQSRYGPRHPETLSVLQQVQQLDQQIDEEARRVMGRLASDATAERARAQSLAGEMAQLRGEQAASSRAGIMAQGIQQQADAKRDAYNRVAAELQQASSLARNTQTQAQIVELAIPPRSPSFPNPQLFIAFGVIAGLGLGLGSVAGLEFMSHGIRTAETLETQLGITCIGSIPNLEKKDLRQSDGELLNPADLLIEHPVIPFSEAFRGIRNTVIRAKQKRPIQKLAIVSSLPGEGKTTSVLAMSRTMALSGDKILLIDCDVRKASLSEHVGATEQAEYGLVEALQGKVDPRSLIRADEIPGLDIIPVKEPFFSAEDLFGDGKIQALVDKVKDGYDYV